MTNFSADRLFVDSIHGGDAHDSYGGNSEASDSEDSDSTDNGVAWLVFGELAQRAEAVERYSLPPGESDIRRLQTESQFDDEDLPEAIARNGRVVLTGGDVHDWVQADANFVFDRSDIR